ncbi:MAG: hybrid sensor histidine kinase/response regulator [Proteobacteria bacterium]|nr:hybrid sensor histidine kinase/response regulator [Pseudomonadota bacterium]
MESRDLIYINADNGRVEMTAENRMLREEIRVSREAAEITAQLVVEQFEKADVIMTRLQSASASLSSSNEELEAANQRLQKLDQMKSDFLSSVSHELRTPLTSIRGFASLVDREFSRSFMTLAGEDKGLQKKSQRIRDNLEIILKESARLTRLINDVLDLAKIEAGRIDWRDTPIQPATLVRDAANAAQGMFDPKPAVSLLLEIQEGLPSFIGDADRLLQVLVNLINNSVKFTDQGSVTVKVLLNQERMIQLEVHDTGIGFPPEEAETIFDKFQQSKHGDTLADQPKGTGLGLSISREIVSRHGGRIWATSTPGVGSVFSLTIPPAPGSLPEVGAISPGIDTLAETEASSTSAAQTVSGAGGKPKVLVVDDDDGVRDYLTQLLQEQGYQVMSAADGLAAIAAAKSFRPDLITMDLAMPVMDGRTAIVKLRADPELQHIPIMVISAIAGLEMAGGDLAMDKPLDEPRFLKNIHLLLDGEKNTGSRAVRFLVLHEASESPERTLGDFSEQCEVDFCTLDELPARIQSGFQGMVVIPTHMIGKVDLSMLQATPMLEVMIMPVHFGKPNRAATESTE